MDIMRKEKNWRDQVGIREHNISTLRCVRLGCSLDSNEEESERGALDRGGLCAYKPKGLILDIAESIFGLGLAAALSGVREDGWGCDAGREVEESGGGCFTE